jgi:membrane protease YdiL (CAAX protease family)
VSRLALVLACTALFCACFLALGRPWLLHLFGVVSLLIGAALLWSMRDALLGLLRPRLRDVGVGIGLGALMIALTYPIYALAVELVPALAPETAKLYAALRPGGVLALPLLWLPLVGAVEELLFRGALVEVLGVATRPRRAALLALLVYTLGQAASASLVVVLLSFGCGAIWTAARLWSRGLIAPLLSHVIWSTTLLGLVPLA